LQNLRVFWIFCRFFLKNGRGMEFAKPQQVAQKTSNGTLNPSTARLAVNKHLRIAIADDDAVNRHFLSHMLHYLGHDVVCVAHDGRELADYCLQFPPDLVITDVNMPRLDGISAAAEITQHNDIPIVLLSGSELPSVVEPLRHVSVLVRRAKPISRLDLEEVLREVIKLSESFATTT
jgi:CheY-like chemotaxis protein